MLRTSVVEVNCDIKFGDVTTLLLVRGSELAVDALELVTVIGTELLPPEEEDCDIELIELVLFWLTAE